VTAPKLLTPDEVKDILRLKSVGAVYELCRPRAARPLPAIKVGKYLRIKESDLLAWIEEGKTPRV
jgi:hypothetical protein